MYKFTRNIIILIISLLLCGGIALAQESADTIRIFKAVELLSGYAVADLKNPQGHYELYPVILALDFNLKPLVKKIGVNYPGLVEVQLEPFISTVAKPDANVEVGNAFMLKIGILPETSRFQPYIKAGVGMLYMTQHTLEQGTQFNFLEQGAAGAHYYLNNNLAITADYRFRHVSNAGIDEPNGGINTSFFLLGATYRFE